MKPNEDFLPLSISEIRKHLEGFGFVFSEVEYETPYYFLEGARFGFYKDIYVQITINKDVSGQAINFLKYSKGRDDESYKQEYCFKLIHPLTDYGFWTKVLNGLGIYALGNKKADA